MAAAGADDSVTEGSLFEALFAHGLVPAGDFKAELLRVGVDVDRLKGRYTGREFRDALEVARRHVHPQLRDDEAYRLLGRLLMVNFLNTLVGRVLGVALPLMHAKSFLERTPRFIRMGRPQVKVRVVAVPGEAQAMDVSVEDPSDIPPGVLLGIAEVGLERVAAVPHIEVTARAAGRFTMRVRWS
jgi:uncharacterized protein (TIGR02265 family)